MAISSTNTIRLPWKATTPSRFFVEAEPTLQALLESYLKSLSASVPDSLKPTIQAIVLGGGYGRGEGGVFHEGKNPPRLYNDLDFFVFTKNPYAPALNHWAQTQAHSGKQTLGIDVDFKCLPIKDIIRDKGSMMFYDLIHGHIVAYGDPHFLTPYREHYPQGRLNEDEATRLLWNRGTGLYFAKQAIQQKKDSGFVQKNHAKLKLALGDSLTVISQYYSASVRARHATLFEIPLPHPWGEHVLALHREGVAFKLYPRHEVLSWKALEVENRALTEIWAQVFLHVEGERLKRPFISLNDYATNPHRVLPNRPWKLNIGIAGRDILKRHACIRPIYDYPRAGLFRALAALLSGKIEGQKIAAHSFFPTPKTPEALQTAYRKGWEHYG